MVQGQIFHSTWSTRQRNLPLQSCLIPFPQMNYVLIVVLTTSFLSLFPNLWVPFIQVPPPPRPSTAPCSKLIQPPRPNYVLPPLWSLPWLPQLDKPSPFPELLSWAPITRSLCYSPACKLSPSYSEVSPLTARHILVITWSPIFQNNPDCKYLMQWSSSVCSYLSHYVF